MIIYVTAYNLTTKECLAASAPTSYESLSHALSCHTPVAPRVISHSKHLLLLDFNGAGLAFSDFRFRNE